MLFLIKIKPVALVEYDRKPYISRFDNSFRITFDAKLETSQSYGLFEKEINFLNVYLVKVSLKSSLKDIFLSGFMVLFRI